REVNRTPAEVVFVLPNNKYIIMAADQCVHMVREKQVIVIPTRSVPQGISALIVLDPDATIVENETAMRNAMERVKTSEITYAARDSDFDGVAIKQGDYLALTEQQLFGTDRDLKHLLKTLAQAAPQQEAEFINIFYGEDITEKQAQQALEIFTKSCPNADVSLHAGGQPVYYYTISAE
ncbi:MAG: DAK2 domain-containing protein, partial [Oscillospiraceae bacterium]|nr:DAK2 domain-containing protein [Oscillospiraceae bacterium]